MANWFVYDTNGNKSGPISSSQLKKLADTRRINRETIIETETGRKAKVAQVKGLFTEKSNSGEAPSAPGKKTSSERTWYYYDVVGIKCGPVNSLQLKKLASSKSINEETVIENQAGRKEKAGNIKGLFPYLIRDIISDSQLFPFDMHGTAEIQNFGDASANTKTLGGYLLEGFAYSDSQACHMSPVGRIL